MKKEDKLYYYALGDDKGYVEMDEVLATELLKMKREVCAQERRMRYHGVFFSLDRSDGFVGYGTISSDEETPEEQLMTREIKTILMKCVQKLPKIQKKRIILHYFKGLSITEIARCENVSWTAVDLSVKKGVQNLKKYFLKMYEGN